ncbi:L-tryptophan--pyruvate aminotransferase [Ranunculus cassubicifolius]
MNSSQFMDKQIMDLSRSQNNLEENPIFDLLNQQEKKQQKDDIILPSYDFQPIRPVTNSSSSLNVNGATTRVWNSADSIPNTTRSVQNNSYQDPDEATNFSQVKDHTVYDASILSEIDQTMKKHADILLHSLEVVSARLSQMETRTRKLENTVDNLKVSVENDNGSTDGKLRQLENILREVQTGVQVLRDKQEIAEAQLHLAKLQAPKFDQSPEKAQITPQSEYIHQTPPPPPPPHVAPLPPPQQIPVSVPPNVLPPPPPLQNQPPAQQHPQREHYFQPPGQIPEGTHQQYQLPPTQQLQSTPPVQPQQHYQAPQFPQYSQAPPPQQHPPPPVGGSVNPSILPQMQQPPPDEATYIQQPQSYPPPSLLRQSSLTQTPTGGPPPPSQQYYGPPPPSQMYDRPNTGFSQGYGEPSYPYGGGAPPPHYGSSSMKLPSSPSAPSGGGGGYPRLPTAQILPQAIPTANSVGAGGGSSSSSGAQNRVPIDDVVDKVSTMGFSREQVRATVRKLTENGQSVDLNVVLDKLMNDGEIQPQKGWFGR